MYSNKNKKNKKEILNETAKLLAQIFVAQLDARNLKKRSKKILKADSKNHV